MHTQSCVTVNIWSLMVSEGHSKLEHDLWTVLSIQKSLRCAILENQEAVYPFFAENSA